VSRVSCEMTRASLVVQNAVHTKHFDPNLKGKKKHIKPKQSIKCLKADVPALVVYLTKDTCPFAASLLGELYYSSYSARAQFFAFRRFCAVCVTSSASSNCTSRHFWLGNISSQQIARMHLVASAAAASLSMHQLQLSLCNIRCSSVGHTSNSCRISSDRCAESWKMQLLAMEITQPLSDITQQHWTLTQTLQFSSRNALLHTWPSKSTHRL